MCSYVASELHEPPTPKRAAALFRALRQSKLGQGKADSNDRLVGEAIALLKLALLEMDFEHVREWGRFEESPVVRMARAELGDAERYAPRGVWSRILDLVRRLYGVQKP